VNDPRWTEEQIEREMAERRAGETLVLPVPPVVRRMMAAPVDYDAPPKPRPVLLPDAAQARAMLDDAARRRRDDLDLLADARRTLPIGEGQEFNWLPTLDLGGLRAPAAGWLDYFEAARDSWLAARSVLIYSPDSGAGKTTLAILFALYVLALAEGPTATHAAIERARGLRFVPERDIAPPYEIAKDYQRLDEALRATVLIVDDMGDVGANQPRIERVQYLLKHRRQHGGGVLVCTTFLDYDQWARRYDGGNGRRVYKQNPSEGQIVIDLTEQAPRVRP